MTTPYHINFCFPIPQELENTQIRLTPFIPSEHAKFFFGEARDEAIYEFPPWGPFNTFEEFLHTAIDKIQPNPAIVVFAVFNKATAMEPEELAGMIGFLNASPANLSIEIGYVITLPKFQCTHVTLNAIGLLLHLALDTPEAGGLVYASGVEGQ
ncbi:hypothetical protein B0H10DRAFT_1956748 [Mycena sp. CBHHK59/15]|nr:hypothetical protein B0H10DRAFT_1956748 [Mycena sp. CBHHK59/15]